MWYVPHVRRSATVVLAICALAGGLVVCPTQCMAMPAFAQADSHPCHGHERTPADQPTPGMPCCSLVVLAEPTTANQVAPAPPAHHAVLPVAVATVAHPYDAAVDLRHRTLPASRWDKLYLRNGRLLI